MLRENAETVLKLSRKMWTFSEKGFKMNAPVIPSPAKMVFDIKIEDNIPLPPKRNISESERFRQAMLKMEIGQSFAFGKQFYARVQRLIATDFRPKGKFFAIRQLTDTSYRIWRLGEKP